MQTEPPPIPEPPLAPTSDAIALREKLIRLINETDKHHEAAVAREKLTSLEARFDFSLPTSAPDPDLLFPWAEQRNRPSCRSGPESIILVTGDHNHHIMNYVKWGIRNLGVESYHAWFPTLKHSSLPALSDGISFVNLGALTLKEGVRISPPRRRRDVGYGVLLGWGSTEEITQARRCASFIAKHMAVAWNKIRTNHILMPHDEVPFLCGMYDGLFDVPNPSGQPIPFLQRANKRQSTSVKRRLKAQVSLHPYELGFEIGNRVRVRGGDRSARALLSRLGDRKKSRRRSVLTNRTH